MSTIVKESMPKAEPLSESEAEQVHKRFGPPPVIHEVERGDDDARLSKKEHQRLRECCDVVDEAIRQQLAAARALLEIRDCKLYRETHASFETFVKDRFDLSRSRTYQLMDFATIEQSLSTQVDTETHTFHEKHARALKRVPPEERATVWKAAERQAEKNGKPEISAENLSKLVRKAYPPDEPLETTIEFDLLSAQGTVRAYILGLYEVWPEKHWPWLDKLKDALDA